MLRRGAKTLVFWFSRAFFVFFVCFFWFFLVFPRLFAFLRFCSCFSLKNDFFAVGNKCFARGFAWKWGFRSRFCLKTAVLLEVLVENSCFARSFAWKLVFRSKFCLEIGVSLEVFACKISSKIDRYMKNTFFYVFLRQKKWKNLELVFKRLARKPDLPP